MKKATVSIEPYFDSDVPNMGFEKYGLNTAPGAEVTEFLSKDVNGRYLTGLDVNSPSIMYMEDEETKSATVKEIKETLKRLETIFGKDTLDAKNDTFWREFTIKLGSNGKDLDMQAPRDEIVYYAIKAGGFTAVAPSLEVARDDPDSKYKFYLRQLQQDSELKIQRSLTLAHAKGLLFDMYQSDQHLMYLVSKSVLNPNNEFSKKTPPGVIFEKLEAFIDGTIVKDNKKATVKQFLDTCKLDKESLYIQGLIKDSIYFFVLQREPDGYFYNKETESRLGKNEKEIFKFLQNPTNQTDLENIKSRVEAKLGN